MMQVCPQCGAFSESYVVIPEGEGRAFLRCPHCQADQPIRYQPLFLIMGASGSGKSELTRRLALAQNEVVSLDSDILWSPAFDTPQDSYLAFCRQWLRLCFSIAQSGRSVALGTCCTADQFHRCPQSQYFSRIYVILLVCGDECLAQRLMARPSWRDSGGEEFVEGSLRYNRWLTENAGEDYRIDTSRLSPQQTMERAREWIVRHSI